MTSWSVRAAGRSRSRALTLKAERVVEVWAPASERPFGSGYLISDGLVLTAGHVVDGAGRGIEVRPLGQDAWIRARVVWRGKLGDVALLRLTRRRPGRLHVRIGQFATDRRAQCRGVGFPLAQEHGGVRDTEDIVGEIVPGAGAKRGVLTVTIQGSVPAADDSGHSPWEGMSGAAIFSAELLVGVVVVHPRRFGGDRLEVDPIKSHVADREFCTALGLTSGTVLAAVEDELAISGVVNPPREALPTGLSPRQLRQAPSYLLRPEFGVVPFHGRHSEMAALLDWCESDIALQIQLVVGSGGCGKTRLAAELCTRMQDEGWVAGFLRAGSGTAASKTLRDAVSPMLVVVDDAQLRPGEVLTVLDSLARAERSTPTRILLLAREIGDWWEAAQTRYRGPALAEHALATTHVIRLPVMSASLDERQASFQAAADAFAPCTSLTWEGTTVPDLVRDEFGDPLFVHVAALSAVLRASGPTVVQATS